MRRGILISALWCVLFAIAMAYLESAVVVYLRALFFPNGFTFPLPTMDRHILLTELGREIATIVMLWAPAAMLSHRRLERFAWFLLAFGVWDIFYYVWLKVLLDWPASLFDMDILFLVPVPWVGPVIAPCIVSMGFIALAALLLKARNADQRFTMRWTEWAGLGSGALVILWSFLGDHVVHTLATGEDAVASGPAYLLKDTGLEAAFSWPIFLSGTLVALVAMAGVARRTVRQGVASPLNRAIVEKNAT